MLWSSCILLGGNFYTPYYNDIQISHLINMESEDFCIINLLYFFGGRTLKVCKHVILYHHTRLFKYVTFCL
jgi:hypothetical protein